MNFRIGVLGSGFIVSECHLPSYAKAGYNVVAIASRTKEKAEAKELVKLCREAGILPAVNQNMRHDPSVKAAKGLIERGELGEPVFATIDMRGIPHWQPWQAETGGATMKIMSIHHLDCMRHWFGDPERIFCSVRPDPRTDFSHQDGICTYILEYAKGMRAVIINDVWTGSAKEGAPADIRIEGRIEGLDGLAIGDIGWCKDPYTSPSTMRYGRKGDAAMQVAALDGSWFPDTFAGTMGDVFQALDSGGVCALSGEDNLKTLALIEAAERSVREKRSVALAEIIS